MDPADPSLTASLKPLSCKLSGSSDLSMSCLFSLLCTPQQMLCFPWPQPSQKIGFTEQGRVNPSPGSVMVSGVRKRKIDRCVTLPLSTHFCLANLGFTGQKPAGLLLFFSCEFGLPGTHTLILGLKSQHESHTFELSHLASSRLLSRGILCLALGRKIQNMEH